MSRLPPAVKDALSARFGDRFSVGEALREQHGRGESYHAAAAPDAVVFAQNTEDVAEIVRLCAAHQVPVIAFGAGTSLEGHLSAIKGGVSIDLSRMNQILRVSAEDLDCTVEAGVTREQLNSWLRDHGLFFPIDPGANATLGGMASTRASGTNAVRYGTMRENVLSLTVVLPNGQVIKTGGRARKSSAGYDLTRLFVGSEGTLGIITEVTLRLYGIPESTAVALCSFADTAQAIDTAIAVIQLGIPVARMEFMDRGLMAASIAMQTCRLLWKTRWPSNSMDRLPPRASRSNRWRHWLLKMAGVILHRQRRWKIATACGRHATTPFMRWFRKGRAHAAGRPMSACPCQPLASASALRENCLHPALFQLPFWPCRRWQLSRRLRH